MCPEGTLARDVPITHKEGSSASLACGHVSLEEMKTVPGHPYVPRACVPQAAALPLAFTSHIWELVAPKRVCGSRAVQQWEEDAQLLLKAAANGHLSGKGNSSGSTRLHAKGHSQPKPATLLSLLQRGEHYPAAFLLFLWMMRGSGLLRAPHHSDDIHRRSF